VLTVGGEFDGIGLLAYGLHLAGLEHRWLCEAGPWRRSILAKRWPGIPIFDDVRAVGARSAERVDVIAGGFPCKGASTAGKRNGFEHPETVLWREMARTIRELRPRYVLVENVANLLAVRDGAVWGEVVGDLAASGYSVTWDCLPAAAVGATHLRDRVFAVATYTAEPRRAGGPRLDRGAQAVADADGTGQQRDRGQRREPDGRSDVGGGDQAPADPDLDRLRQQPELERGRRDAALAAEAGRGVAVDWGKYRPAIRRWEAVVGPTPEPLVRRVDDGRARRVERSRLSALGDGVCVQVGIIAGAYIVELETRRLAGEGLADAA
jgi:DNA (cytosine-5)-methyltransferase 1